MDISNWNFLEKCEAARDFKTSADVLKNLSLEDDYIIRCEVARNKATPLHILEYLVNDTNFNVIADAVSNPSQSARNLIVYAGNYYASTRLAVAKNPNLPREAIDILYSDTCYNVVMAIAEHPNTPMSTLDALSRGSNPKVKEKALQRIMESNQAEFWSTENETIYGCRKNYRLPCWNIDIKKSQIVIDERSDYVIYKINNCSLRGSISRLLSENYLFIKRDTLDSIRNNSLRDVIGRLYFNKDSVTTNNPSSQEPPIMSDNNSTPKALVSFSERGAKNGKAVPYRVARKQLTKLMQDMLIEALVPSGDKVKKSLLFEILSSENGAAGIMSIGGMLPHAPLVGEYMQNNKHLMAIADDMQQEGAATFVNGGLEMMKKFLPGLESIKEMLSQFDSEEETETNPLNARVPVLNTQANPIVSEQEEELEPLKKVAVV